MKKHICVNQSNTQELSVPSQLVTKLYNLITRTENGEEVWDAMSQSTDDGETTYIANQNALTGMFTTDYTYKKYVDKICGYFKLLKINADGWYILFDDPYLNQIMISLYASDRVGVKTSDLAKVSNITAIKNYTNYNRIKNFNILELTNCTIGYNWQSDLLPQSCKYAMLNYVQKMSIHNVLVNSPSLEYLYIGNALSSNVLIGRDDGNSINKYFINTVIINQATNFDNFNSSLSPFETVQIENLYLAFNKYVGFDLTYGGNISQWTSNTSLVKNSRYPKKLYVNNTVLSEYQSSPWNDIITSQNGSIEGYDFVEDPNNIMPQNKIIFIN